MKPLAASCRGSQWSPRESRRGSSQVFTHSELPIPISVWREGGRLSSRELSPWRGDPQPAWTVQIHNLPGLSFTPWHIWHGITIQDSWDMCLLRPVLYSLSWRSPAYGPCSERQAQGTDGWGTPCCNYLKESGLRCEPDSEGSSHAQDLAGHILTPVELQDRSLVHASNTW